MRLFHLPTVCSVSAAAIVALAPSTLFAQITYATGTFSSNAPATITCQVVSLSSGTLDTTFVYQTGAGNTVDFSLPYAISVGMQKSSAVGSVYAARLADDRVHVNLPAAYAGSIIRLLDLSGRSEGVSQIDMNGRADLFVGNNAAGVRLLQICGATSQTARLVINGSDASVHMTGVSRMSTKTAFAAAGSARYTVTVTSRDAGYENIAAQDLDFTEGANGTKAFTLPAVTTKPSERFAALFPQTLYESMFPMRYGMGASDSTSIAPSSISSGLAGTDFYSYNNWKTAIDSIANIRLILTWHDGAAWQMSNFKMTRINKKTGASRTFYNFTDYNTLTGTEVSDTIDYADFCAVGSDETRKLELSAFFANASHETTGGWPTAPIGQYAWGLYFVSEGDGAGGSLQVPVANNSYPPNSSQYYYGRGPLQLSYNYNYGLCSEILFDDKNLLLDNASLVAQHGVVAIMTAIWFWMTPQPPKPSCHDVMCDLWKPSAADISAGRTSSKFGMTINVINGGLECNQSGNPQAQDRENYYRNWFTSKFGVTPEATCNCASMSSY